MVRKKNVNETLTAVQKPVLYVSAVQTVSVSLLSLYIYGLISLFH